MELPLEGYLGDRRLVWVHVGALHLPGRVVAQGHECIGILFISARGVVSVQWFNTHTGVRRGEEGGNPVCFTELAA